MNVQKTEELKVSHIRKQYKNKQILRDIQFRALSGKCIGILGANGSGKSTLLAILAGVLKPDAGSVWCDQVDLMVERKQISKIIGYVPQGTPLLEELTAWDNLLLWYDKPRLQQELEGGVLGMLGIDKFLKTPVCKMSGGMKKRLSIGCAVAGNPSVLLMDEPSAALDLECKERILNYLKSFILEGGIVILATHDIREIEICDEWYILKEGILHPYAYDGNIHHLVGKL